MLFQKPRHMTWNIPFEVLKGQDIIDFREDAEQTFIKITCENIWDYYL